MQVARRLSLKVAQRDPGERLLTSKLQILNGTGNRRPSIALSILTGRMAEQLSILESFYAQDPAVVDAPEPEPHIKLVEPTRPQLVARTVYLTEAHLRDIEIITDALQEEAPRRLTRSAVLRRAIEHLRRAVEADPANFLLESEF